MKEEAEARVIDRNKLEVPYIEPPPRDLRDTKDEDEDRAFADERDLSREKEISRHERSEVIHDTLSKGCKLILWFAILAILIMAASWVFHVVAPEHLHYLKDNQINDIKASLFSGAVGAFMAKYLEQFLS